MKKYKGPEMMTVELAINVRIDVSDINWIEKRKFSVLKKVYKSLCKLQRIMLYGDLPQ